MSVNVWIISIFLLIAIGVASYVAFEKNYEDPLNRNKNFAKNFFSMETISDNRVIMMTVTKANGEVIGKQILPFAFIEEGKPYRVGRIRYSPTSKKLREKIGFRLCNKDLWYGIECLSGGRSGLSSNQFYVKKIVDESTEDYTLVLQSEYECGSGKGMYRADDNIDIVPANLYRIVPETVKTVTYATENNMYFFEFETIDLYEQNDCFKLEDFQKEYISSIKKERERSKISIKNFFPDDGTEPDVILKNAMKIEDEDRTRPYNREGKEGTKVYRPQKTSQKIY